MLFLGLDLSSAAWYDSGMTTRTRLILFLALLVISVGTLVQAVTGDDNTFVYVVATSLSHIALLAVGFWYNQGRTERHNAWREQLRSDILGE